MEIKKYIKKRKAFYERKMYSVGAPTRAKYRILVDEFDTMLEMLR